MATFAKNVEATIPALHKVRGSLVMKFRAMFDEAWYLTTYPDVAETVRSGSVKSGYDHFIEHGFKEGRVPIKPIFDEAWYLTTYPDAAEAVRSGRAKSGYDHFIEFGYAEGRKPNRHGGQFLPLAPRESTQ